MKTYFFDNIESYDSINNAEPFSCKVHEKKAHFMFASVVTSLLLQKPVWVWALDVLFLLLFVILSSKEFFLVYVVPFLFLTLLAQFIYIVIQLKAASSIYKTVKDLVFRFDREGLAVCREDEYGIFIKLDMLPWESVFKVVNFANTIGVYEVRNFGAMFPCFTIRLDKKYIPQLYSLWKENRVNNYADARTPIPYTENEEKQIITMLRNQFGAPIALYRQKKSKYVNANILVFPPTNEHPFYTLSTLGIGARAMKMPKNVRTRENNLDYSEFLMFLPADWVREEKEIHDPKHWWCVSFLGDIATASFSRGCAYGYGDVIQTDSLNHGVLVCPNQRITQTIVCSLICGKSVEFNQVIRISAAEYSKYTDECQHFGDLLRDIFPKDIKDINDIEICKIADKNMGKV
ncbi:MAG: suppressor of fused domain protein [Paludibacteraceae bacterium]|nr:suppressor of fused domain protein [Paludibacteraceae bacterium]